MGAGCGFPAAFDGMSPDCTRRLWIVIALDAGMFAVEMGAGKLAGSQALQADALEFSGDAPTYGVSLAVIGASVAARSATALAKGVSLLLMALYVFGATLHRMVFLGVPEAGVTGVVGFPALLTNLASVALLVRCKDGDANVRSVGPCSRNDAGGNVAVMAAALGVRGAGSGWPDVIVAAIRAGLFLHASTQILSQALRERRAAAVAEQDPSAA